MSVRQLLRLTAVLAALLLLWGAVALAGRRAEAAGGGSAPLLGVDTAAVDSVLLAGGGRDSTVLARTKSGWTVNDHPASGEETAALLRELADTARFDLVAESEASHARLGVDADSGRRVIIRGRGPARELVIGARAGGFGGGYARRPGERAVYRVRGRLPALVARAPDDWRDKTIAAAPADSITAVEVTRGRERYALRRDGTRWRFAGGGAADSLRAADLIRELGRISAAGFATAAQAETLRFNRPERRLTVTGPGDRALAALVFDSTGDAFWVRRDSGGTVWRIDSWVVDRVTPSAASLR